MTIREIAEFKKKVWVSDDVTLDGIATLSVATKDSADMVYDTFVSHGYQISSVPGEFLKVFTMNAREVAELEKTLLEIDALGLKDVLQNNLRLVCFKREFLESLKVFLNNNLPYLNEDHTFISEVFDVAFSERLQFCINNGFVYRNADNTFVKELYDVDLFAQYTAHKPLEAIKTAQEVKVMEEKNSGLVNDHNSVQLDDEDRQVYNEVVKNLSYLELKNPTNEYLPVIVKNILKNIVGALVRKEYRFLTLREVVEGVMFEGIDVTPEMENVRDLVLSAFPLENDLNVGRGLA